MKNLYARSFIILLLSMCGVVQAQTVVGKIRSSKDGEPLVGAIVRSLQSGQGAAADLDGNYQLKLSVGKHTLEYGLVGYTTITKEVTLAADQTITLNIQLNEETTSTDEVVVVGYGVQRKRELTGAISKIEGKELNRFPVPSFEAALQGQAAGIQVSQGSGLAGSGSLVRIRGIASISAGGDPLYVVDGIPITQDQFLGGNSGGMNTNPLATINPNDIASVEILKDAAATGIYGSRGSNGVILITTKRGSKKGLEVNYSSRFGIGVAATLPNMMNTKQYLAIRQEAWENDGGTGYVWLPNYTSESDPADVREAAFKEASRTNTDWVDELTGVGFKTMQSISISNRWNKDALYANLTYDYNGSYLVGNSYRRLSGRLNWDHTFGDKLKMFTGLSYTQGTNNRISAAWNGGLGEAMSTALPYYKVRNEDGTYYTWNNGYSNPVMYANERPWKYIEDRVLVNLGLVYTIMKDLNLRGTVNADGLRGADYQFYPKGLNNDYIQSSKSNTSIFFVPNINGNLTLDYLRTVKEHHNFTFLVGTEMQHSRTYNRYESYFNAQGLWNNQDNRVSGEEGVEVTRDAGSFYPTTETARSIFTSAFARVNYNYKSKYFLQAVGRMDGSSKFGVNNKLGFFPTISGGWILSEENFLKDNNTISFMKLRAGWGMVGNSNIDQNAQYGTRTMRGSYNGQPILYTEKLPNPNLKWEKSTTLDAGFEIGLFKDRLAFTLEVYRKMTHDALMNVNLAQSTGFSSYTDNVAQILNRGIELGVTAYIISNKNFQWRSVLNLARNYNELVDIGDYSPDAVSGGTNDSRVIVGKPIGSFYLQRFSHIESATGRPVYLDQYGNPTYDYDFDFGRQFVGTGLPKVSGGFNNTFTYKNWQLTAFATFSLGAKIFDSSGKRQMGVVTNWNMRTELLDRWRQPGDVTDFPFVTLTNSNYGMDDGQDPWWNIDKFVYKADYLRMKNIDIAYIFNFKGASKVKELRIGFNVTNLFTITNFPGLDPEVVRDFENPQDRNMSPNVTYLTPPQEKSYNINISATF